MSFFEQIKDFTAIIQKIGNMELNKKILALQTSAIALEEENRELAERVRQLEEKARMQASLDYQITLYWKRDETGKEEEPYCPWCWDADRKIVHLRVNKEGGSYCQNCRSGFDEPADFATAPDVVFGGLNGHR